MRNVSKSRRIQTLFISINDFIARLNVQFSHICLRNGASLRKKEGRNKRISRTTFNQLSDHR
jgi:hypothetical protein